MTSLLRRSPNNTLTMVEEYKTYYEYEWFQGFSNTITFIHQNIFPLEAVPFTTNGLTGSYNDIPSLSFSEISLLTRFAKQEKFLLGEFERVSLGSEFPILELRMYFGIKGFLNSDFNYTKVRLTVKDKVELDPFGHLKYILEGGRIFGQLPYPLLELHKGNETYAYDFLAFNMMNYYEFVSDTYFSWITEQHFQGFFLNRIPLLRKLGWREIVSARGVIGTLSENNRDVWNFPSGLVTLTKPYMEAGVGIENVFKFFRLDMFWRLSYLDHPEIQKVGLRLGMQVIL